MTSTVADFYGVPGQGMVQQVDSITLSHTSPAALSKKGIVSYPALETAGAAPTGDVITVFDVTTSTALVLNTDYTLTPSGTSPETLTYSVTRINSSSASADSDTAKVTYRYGVQRLPQSGEFGGYAGTAPTGTQSQASTTDTEGASASGLGSAGGYGSLTDPAAGAQSSSETGSPGSEYAVNEVVPGTYGPPLGSPDTEGAYGGGLPSSYSPVLGANYSQGNIGSTADPGGLDTVAAGGSNLVPSEYSSPPGYRAPSSGVAAGTKDTTLTDILGNQQNATAASPPSGYAAAQVDTLYFGAPDQPTSMVSQTDTFAATAASTPYYLTQQGLDPTSIVVTDTTTPATLVLNTDYTVTTAGNGAGTVSYITLSTGTNYTAADNISVTYNFGDFQYWGSNVPASVPGSPGTPSVTAVNRGVKCTWTVPSGVLPVDYFLLQAEDFGTMYVPATGQPVEAGQPSGSSGGATAGEPTYQADTIGLKLATPTGLAITQQGTPGTTHYSYRVSAVGVSGETLAEAEVTTTTGAATLNGTNYNHLAWNAVAGAAGYNVYGRTVSAELKMTPTPVTATTFDDKGSVTPAGALPTANTTGLLSQAGILTPPGQVIVRDVTSAAQSILTSGQISGGEADPLQADGQVLEYGYDYTITQTGTGPWASYAVALAAGSLNAAAGDTLIVEYWYGADPSSVSATFTQGLVENTAVIYKPDGSTYSQHGYRFKVAAGNKAGLGAFSSWSAYAVPLNYNAPQPGHEGATETITSLDSANTINPIYSPDGTIKAGTGLGG